jgi:TM2 domain-containing membrane protein YozV
MEPSQGSDEPQGRGPGWVPDDRTPYTYEVPAPAVPQPAPPAPPAYGRPQPSLTRRGASGGEPAFGNPAVPVLVSFFLPGVGSVLNGHRAKGVALFLAYALSWVLAVTLAGVVFVAVIGVWLWGLVDAYRGARTDGARSEGDDQTP